MINSCFVPLYKTRGSRHKICARGSGLATPSASALSLGRPSQPLASQAFSGRPSGRMSGCEHINFLLHRMSPEFLDPEIRAELSSVGVKIRMKSTGRKKIDDQLSTFS